MEKCAQITTQARPVREKLARDDRLYRQRKFVHESSRESDQSQDEGNEDLVGAP